MSRIGGRGRMWTILLSLAAFASCLSLSPTCAAQASGKKANKTSVKAKTQDDKLSAQVDTYMAEVMKGLRIPGASIAIVREGKVIKARGYGLANVEHKVAAKPETVYLLASITKSFTATAITMLVEEGKIGLDDRISKYLDDTPDSWKEITVRHLLTHTAGLKDRFEGRTAQDWLLTFTTPVMYKAARETPVDFTPGTNWQYSDQGYFLLGMIIEKVSGKSYRAFLAERIFTPLGMTRTTTIRLAEIIPDMASGYTLVGTTLYHNNRRTDYGVVSHFGIISTVLDLAKWDAALYGEKLLKQSTLAQMWTPAPLKDGTVPRSTLGSYGLGWFLDDFFGHRIVEHAGSTGTCIRRLPDDKTTVIVLTNLEALAGGDAPSMARQIARMYVPALTWVAVKPKPDPDPKQSQALREEILRVAEGKPDISLYTPIYGPAVKTATQSSVRFYKSIGPLKTFTYLGSKPNGVGRIFYYRADYRGMTLFYTVSLTKEGKIDSLSGEPGGED